MVPTRWCNCPYSESIHGGRSENVPEHVISLRGELPRPASSPDLSACDYFLWGYLKAKAYTTRPWTIDDLKIAIRKQISAIPENMARREQGNLRARLEECVCSDGQDLRDLPLKTK
jgi:hypothetical protein